jgi:hypothetical protein
VDPEAALVNHPRPPHWQLSSVAGWVVRHGVQRLGHGEPPRSAEAVGQQCCPPQDVLLSRTCGRIAHYSQRVVGPDLHCGQQGVAITGARPAHLKPRLLPEIGNVARDSPWNTWALSPSGGAGCSGWRDRDSPAAAVALTRLGTSLPTACNVEGQSRLAKTLSSGHVVGHNNPDPGLRRGTVPEPSAPAPAAHTAPFGCEEFLPCLRH